jgi:cation diffusion facilitator CzcD-associated flavoprotein CzcO
MHRSAGTKRRGTSLRAKNGGFELELADDRLEARSVVVATGAFQQPTANPAQRKSLRA